MTDIKFDLPGLDYLRDSKAINKAVRIAMNRAMAPIKQAVENGIPSETGLLKKAQRIKIMYYSKAKEWLGLVGVGVNIKKKKKVKKKKTAKKKAPRKRKPKTISGKALRAVSKVAKVALKKLKRLKITKNIKKRIQKRLNPDQYIRPARYAHLVEWGGKRIRAKEYLLRARRLTADNFADAVITGLRDELAKIK